MITNLPNFDDINPTDVPPSMPPTQNMATTSDQTAVTSVFVMLHCAYSSAVGIYVSSSLSPTSVVLVPSLIAFLGSDGSPQVALHPRIHVWT